MMGARLRLAVAAALGASAAVVAQPAVPLVPGRETPGAVGFQAYSYFTTTITPNAYALLSLYLGDASLAINLGAGRLAPTIGAADYVATSAVFLPVVSQLFTTADAAWTTYCGGSNVSCAATIGVYGVQPSNFSIAVTVSALGRLCRLQALDRYLGARLSHTSRFASRSPNTHTRSLPPFCRSRTIR